MTMPLIDEVNNLIREQVQEWAQAAQGYAALNDVQTTTIPMPGLDARVQFNPARIVSTGAKVDAASLRARKCFLCAENRPEAQRGISWNGHYTVLVNPFPIFPRHLTIPDNSHTPQLIKGRIADMMRLAIDLEGYTVFYNGPKCGASAPDHMHFQAGNSDFLPIHEAIEKAELRHVADNGSAGLSVVAGLPLNLFVIDTTKPEDGELLFNRLYDALPVKDDETEPMMNILCRADVSDIRMIVIPRKKHRPSFYGTEGEGCMLPSPASVDLGGVFITPRPEDFRQIDSSVIGKVYDELCLSCKEIENIIQKID